jgi:DNA mismatch endonuclease, patch repair protein
MTDRVSQKRRSEIMSLVKNKGTKPEMAIRQKLHRLGYRYRVHRKDLPGKPDLVFPRLRKAIFVHGCFWHGHRNCSYGRLPKSNLDYWGPKLERNKERDAENIKLLREGEWEVLVVWQCELKDMDAVVTKLIGFLEKDREAACRQSGEKAG